VIHKLCKLKGCAETCMETELICIKQVSLLGMPWDYLVNAFFKMFVYSGQEAYRA
jgi:hypothetical protein